MIGLLEGEIISKGPTQVVIRVGGVGYRVHIPLSTFYALPEPPARISLLIHTRLQEDALNLYGFGTPEEKELFLQLLGIPRIGARMALNILSGIITRGVRPGPGPAGYPPPGRHPRHRQEIRGAHRPGTQGQAARRRGPPAGRGSRPGPRTRRPERPAQPGLLQEPGGEGPGGGPGPGGLDPGGVAAPGPAMAG